MKILQQLLTVLCLHSLACIAALAGDGNPFAKPEEAKAAQIEQEINQLRVGVAKADRKTWKPAYRNLTDTGEAALAQLYEDYQASDNWQFRVLVFDLACDIALERAFPAFAPIAVADPAWQLHSAVLERVKDLKTKDNVDLLLALLEKSGGLIEAGTIETLTQWTGNNFRADKKKWRDWWKESRESFSFAAAMEDRTYTPDAPEFNGLKVSSKNVIFVIDVSLSMQWGKRDEAAREALTKVIDSFANDVSFNILFFAEKVYKWKTDLVLATKENKKSAVNFIQAQELQQATNTHAALTEAMNSATADSIYFLSDGDPTVGVSTNMEAILDVVTGRNKLQRISINTIGFFKGVEPEKYRLPEERKAEVIQFMKDLARENYGTFVEIK